MKKLTIVFAIIILILTLVACGEVTSPQTTTFVSGSNNDSPSSTTTTTHNHSSGDVIGDSTTEDVGGETTLPSGETDNPTDETTDTTTSSDDTTSSTTRPDDSSSGTSTTKSENTTTSGKITTTTKKATTTTSTTTRKTTTTTTKKTTTTTTKKTTTTKAHSFGAATYVKSDMDYHKVTKKCTTCGTTSTTSEFHNFGSWIYDTYPTSTSEGIKYRTCKGCGYEQVTYVPKTSDNVANFEEEMFDLINAERKKNGLPAYTYYTSGQSGANTRAKEIMTLFSHNRPDGSKWWTAPGFEKAVCQAGAENIARGYGSPEDVMAAFMNSADHKKNILSTQYTHIVIAYYEGAWVQIFVKPW